MQSVPRGRRQVHDELCTSRPKVVMDESVNTICALLNEDRRSIMNNGNDEEVKTFTQNYFANLGTQFYQIKHTKISLGYDKCSTFFQLCGKMMFSNGIKYNFFIIF